MENNTIQKQLRDLSKKNLAYLYFKSRRRKP